ncbi:MAG: penicillin-binding protein [Terriglobia bacterium]
MPAATSHARVIGLGTVAFLWLAFILTRLVELQVLRSGEFALRAERQQQRTLTVSPRRGTIYDRNARELAITIGVESAFTVPAEVSDPALAARLLAPIVGQPAAQIARRLRSARSFAWIARKLDAHQVERIRALQLKGIYFQRENKRFYPKRELAAHVLGFVGLDEDGLAGIEYKLDSKIRGPAGRLLIFTDGHRRGFHRIEDAPREGASVVLTLDETIQFIAERELAAAIARTHARAGTLIVAEPKSGEILALANWPTFNPNTATAVPPAYHLNRAVSLVFEPGSTFKVVTVAAALEEGVSRPEEVIDCQQGGIVLAGHLIRDHKPFGLLTVSEIIQESSDVGAIKLGLRLGDHKMYEHIRRWGFGQPTGVGLPAESPGLVRAPGIWSQISIGAIAMGQELAVTPVQLVAAFSAIANGGEWVAPRIVREIVPFGASPGTAAMPPAPHRRIFSRPTAGRLGAMLRGVVRQGTGVLAQPDGYTAAGKTGTAQKIDATGSYSAIDFVASFVGFAPASAPAITVLVVLDSPIGDYHGGEVAAPVFKNVVEQVLAYLNVPPDLAVPPRPAGRRVARVAVRDFSPAQRQSALWTPPAANSDPYFATPSKWQSAAWRAARGGPRGRVILESGESVTVPNFLGQSVRAVVEECARVGLEVVLVGSGVAAEQFPPAGTRLPRQSKVRVEFHRALSGTFGPPARAL